MSTMSPTILMLFMPMGGVTRSLCLLSLRGTRRTLPDGRKPSVSSVAVNAGVNGSVELETNSDHELNHATHSAHVHHIYCSTLLCSVYYIAKRLDHQHVIVAHLEEYSCIVVTCSSSSAEFRINGLHHFSSRTNKMNFLPVASFRL